MWFWQLGANSDNASEDPKDLGPLRDALKGGISRRASAEKSPSLRESRLSSSKPIWRLVLIGHSECYPTAFSESVLELNHHKIVSHRYPCARQTVSYLLTLSSLAAQGDKRRNKVE